MRLRIESMWVTEAIAIMSLSPLGSITGHSSGNGDVTCFGSWGSGSRSSLSESGSGGGDGISGCAHGSLKKQRRKLPLGQQTSGRKIQQLEAEVGNVQITKEICILSQRDCAGHHCRRNSSCLQSYTDIKACHLTEIYAAL